jgi:hypothetical protein
MENKIEYPENLILDIAGTGHYREEIEYAVEHFEENWPYFIEQVSKTHASAEKCGEITIKHYRDHKTLKRFREGIRSVSGAHQADDADTHPPCKD